MKSLPLLSLICLLGLGCQTSNTQNIATSVKTAAYFGTAYALIEHPEWRLDFEQAHGELVLIEQQQTIDFVTIMAIVTRLPVKELKSDKAVLLITAGTIMLSDYGGSLPLDQLEQLRPVVKALREGIALGLGDRPSEVNAQIKRL